jgi:hypothetical protein
MIPGRGPIRQTSRIDLSAFLQISSFCKNARADEPRDAWVANGRAVPKPDRRFVSAFRKAFVSTKIVSM